MGGLSMMTQFLCEHWPTPALIHVDYTKINVVASGCLIKALPGHACIKVRIKEKVDKVGKGGFWSNKIKRALFYCCFTLFIYGRPCDLSSIKQCSGTLFSSENSWFIHWWKEKYIWVCIMTSLILYLLNSQFEFLLKNYIVPLVQWANKKNRNQKCIVQKADLSDICHFYFPV